MGSELSALYVDESTSSVAIACYAVATLNLSPLAVSEDQREANSSSSVAFSSAIPLSSRLGIRVNRVGRFISASPQA